MRDDIAYDLRSPILRRERVKFATDVDIGAGQWLLVRFERDVVWLREETCTWRASINGEVMKEGGTWNGFYGPGTSMDEALGEAESWFAKYGPAMSVEVVLTLREFPAIVSAKPAYYEGAVNYHPLPGWFVDDETFTAWRAVKSPGWWKDHGVRVLKCEDVKRDVVVWRNGAATPEGDAERALLAADHAAMKAAVLHQREKGGRNAG